MTFKHGSQPCLTQRNYKPCHVGPPKTNRSPWRVLTKYDSLEKGMASHFSILALTTPQTVWKGKKDMTLKDDSPGSVGVQYATGEEWRNSYRRNEEAEKKWKQCPVVDVFGGGSKVWCCKEQYCIGIWNVGSMHQGKFEVIEQEMARANADSLGTSELKWTKMGEFNSDDHYIYYSGQESFRRNGVALIVNKRLQNAVLGYNLKSDRIISVFKQTIQHHSNPSLGPNQRSWNWAVLIRPTRPSRTITEKKKSFSSQKIGM